MEKCHWKGPRSQSVGTGDYARQNPAGIAITSEKQVSSSTIQQYDKSHLHHIAHQVDLHRKKQCAQKEQEQETLRKLNQIQLTGERVKEK